MKLFIKNMVCHRCILMVRQELDKLALTPNFVILGEVHLSNEPEKEQMDQLTKNLSGLGFELINDGRKKLIEKIKNIVIDQVQNEQVEKQHNFSEILSKKLNKDYSYLSGLFSDIECITIEKYFIQQRIEKVKELLIYDELNLSEIADRLGYSSVAWLSAQFKKVTGLTPSYFKKNGSASRKSIDST